MPYTPQSSRLQLSVSLHHDQVYCKFPMSTGDEKMPLISLRDRISQWRNPNRKMTHENVRKHTEKNKIKQSSNPNPFLTTICLMWGIIMGLSTRFWFLLVQHCWKCKAKKPHLEFLSRMQAPTNGAWVAGSLNENKDNAVAHWKTGSFFSLQKEVFPN